MEPKQPYTVRVAIEVQHPDSDLVWNNGVEVEVEARSVEIAGIKALTAAEIPLAQNSDLTPADLIDVHFEDLSETLNRILGMDSWHVSI